MGTVHSNSATHATSGDGIALTFGTKLTVEHIYVLSTVEPRGSVATVHACGYRVSQVCVRTDVSGSETNRAMKYRACWRKRHARACDQRSS